VKLNRLLASFIFGSFVTASPALAGIALINGGGVGGRIGANSVGGGNASVSITSTVDVPPGSLVVMEAGMRANASFSGCSDSAGNSYTLVGMQTGAPIANYTCYSITTIDLPIGSTYTATSANTSAKAVIVGAWSGVDQASPHDSASVGTTSPTAGTGGTGTAISIGPSGTPACPGGTNCSLQIGVFTDTSAGTITEDPNFTSFAGTSNTSPVPDFTYRIASSTATISYAPTMSVSGGWAAQLQIFKAASGGSAPVCTMSLTGAGSC